MTLDDSSFRVAVGQTIKALRMERGWTLRDLTGRSGVSTPFLSEVERGLKEPSGGALAQIAEAFEKSLPVFLVEIAQTLDGSVAVDVGDQQREALRRAVSKLDDASIDALIDYAHYLVWRSGQTFEEQ